jgi:hypothetical protein
VTALLERGPLARLAPFALGFASRVEGRRMLAAFTVPVLSAIARLVTLSVLAPTVPRAGDLLTAARLARAAPTASHCPPRSLRNLAQ